MKSIIIDDNADFLSKLGNKGYHIISIVGKSHQNIADELNKYGQIEDICINISLFFNTVNRTDYKGVDLISRLMFEVSAKSWTLLSFERPNNILGKNNITMLSKMKNIKIVDYIKFMEDILNNGKS